QLTTIRGIESAEQVEQSALPRTGRTPECDEFTGANAQADIAQYDDAAPVVTLRYAAGLGQQLAWITHSVTPPRALRVMRNALGKWHRRPPSQTPSRQYPRVRADRSRPGCSL